MSEKWIRCRTCNEVTHVTAHDAAPSYDYDQYLNELREEEVDERESFMAEHQGHALEELTVIKDSFLSEGHYAEPVKVSYCEATNGKEHFVIRKWRNDILAPLRYEIIPGFLTITLQYEVQSDAIRRQIQHEITTPAFEDAQIEKFIQIVEDVVDQFPPDKETEITAETDTPLVSHCKMSTQAIREITRISKELFNEGEVRQLLRFISHNTHDCEPMTLLLKRKFTIKRKRVKGHTPKDTRPRFQTAVAQRSPH